MELTGEVRGYDCPADSGNRVTRAFSPICGAPVSSRNVAMPGMIFLRASSLDDLEVFQPQMHVFTMRAASWDRPGAGLPSSTGCRQGCERPDSGSEFASAFHPRRPVRTSGSEAARCANC